MKSILTKIHMNKLILLIFILSFGKNLNAQLDTLFWFVAPEVIQSHGDRPVVFRLANTFLLTSISTGIKCFIEFGAGVLLVYASIYFYKQNIYILFAYKSI